jgi:hypothetical protein
MGKPYSDDLRERVVTAITSMAAFSTPMLTSIIRAITERPAARHRTTQEAMVLKYPSDMNDLRPLAWPAFNASTTNCTQSTITGGSVA